MRCFFTIAALISFLPAVLGAPTELKPIHRVSGPKKANSYIVTFKQGGQLASVAESIKGKKTVFNPRLVNGFAAELNEKELNELRARDDVDTIEEDGIATISATQTDAPWGLQRISQDGRVYGNPYGTNFTYQYNDAWGYVDVYVIDTGIYTQHNDFGGRARWGATFGGYADADGNGHGTHCAGTIGGYRYGVAKNANLIAVKVLSDWGSGAWSDVISGMSWSMGQALSTGAPSIVSMSIQGPPSPGVDKAVVGLTAAGIHVVVAAGNFAQDADYTSPARSRNAITVAASTIEDKLAQFSNYGNVVDMIAPGVDVLSAYIGSPDASAYLSGTSMACPHVAGLAAYYIAQHGNTDTWDLASKLASMSVWGVIQHLRSDTINLLANNEF